MSLWVIWLALMGVVFCWQSEMWESQLLPLRTQPGAYFHAVHQSQIKFEQKWTLHYGTLFISLTWNVVIAFRLLLFPVPPFCSSGFASHCFYDALDWR
jgi:hypothetical protein